MSEPAPPPSPSPAPAPAPAAAAPAPAPAPAPAAEPAASARPEWLPEAHWDAKQNAIRPEFGQHYQEVAANAQKLAERLAGVPKDPAGYKIELKLPEGVQIPEGVKLDPSKDPRLPLFTKLAHAQGWTNDDVNKLIALDAQLEISAHHAAAAQLVAEDKKLGENATARRAAIANWVRALKEKGDLTEGEAAALNPENLPAVAVTAIEKLRAKATGGIPGNTGDPPAPRPQPKLLKDILYPDQQKAS